MSERDEFEKWAKNKLKGFAGGVELAKDQTNSGWTYYTKAAEVAWRAWQAARAQPEPSSGVQLSECSTCNGEGGTYEPGGHRDAMLFVCPDCDGSGDAPEPSAGAVPEGWKLVPVASTSDMDIAAHDIGIMGVSRDEAEIIWTVMLATAPQPPQEGE